MGVLDVPGTTYAAPKLSAFHRKIARQVTDVTVIVVGDSTGVGTDRFVYLTAQKIAAQWPTHTVKYHAWDDATKTYPAGNDATIQTGSGARTIHVYNGSVSGQVVGYAWNNFSTYTSGLTPDLVIFNYGHNSPQNYDNYRGINHQAVNLFTSNFPAMALAFVVQNPRATGDVDYARDQESQRANYDYAMAEGHIAVDVNSAFIDYGNYAADLLLGDGLHPNPAGSAKWTQLVWDAIKPKPKRAPSSPQASRPSRVWVPANQFSALDGSPALVNHYGIPMWELDPAAALESIVATVDYPSDWNLADINVVWAIGTDTNTSARTVRFNTAFQYISNKSLDTTSFTLGTWTDQGDSSVNSNITSARTNVSTLVQRTAYSGRPVALRIGRKGSDAADTLPTDAFILGVVVQRMY